MVNETMFYTLYKDYKYNISTVFRSFIKGPDYVIRDLNDYCPISSSAQPSIQGPCYKFSNEFFNFVRTYSVINRNLPIMACLTTIFHYSKNISSVKWATDMCIVIRTETDTYHQHTGVCTIKIFTKCNIFVMLHFHRRLAINMNVIICQLLLLMNSSN